MSHVRFPRAAVAAAVASTGRSAITPRCEAPRSSAPPLVLWASSALVVRHGGRLVGVRRTQLRDVEVAWIGSGSTTITWRPASEVLSKTEAKHWLQRARFTKQ